MIKRVCKTCKSIFYVKPYVVRDSCGKFCSISCASKFRFRFPQNHPQWKGGLVSKNCKQCKKIFNTPPSEVRVGKGKFCCKKCYGKWTSINIRGKKFHGWKGDKIGYSGIHMWLKENYGKANKCENKKCFYPRKGDKKWLKKPSRFEWALLRGRKYQRRRNNFIMLCASCHKLYDKK